MKIIQKLTGEATDDGNPPPKFPQSGNVHGPRLSKVPTAKGLLIYKSGIDAAVLIPDDKLDELAIAIEPKFSVVGGSLIDF